MALKADRKVTDGTSVRYFMNETATRGIIVTHDTTATGDGGMEDADNVVQVPTGTGDGVPAGLLMNDVVNLDLSKYHLNQHQDQVQLGGKVTVLEQGQVRTNSIKSGQTPKQGDLAYYAASGELTVTGGAYLVGRFRSGKDTDGYAVVDINITNGQAL